MKSYINRVERKGEKVVRQRQRDRDRNRNINLDRDRNREDGGGTENCIESFINCTDIPKGVQNFGERNRNKDIDKECQREKMKIEL